MITSRSASFLCALALCPLAVYTLPASEAATPRRAPGSFYFGPDTVWTDGTTTELFQPMSEPMPSSALVSARVYLEVTESSSGALRTRPALRYSADGVTWDTAAAINASFVTGNGTQAGSTFVDLTQLATAKAWVQFGVQVKNSSAGEYELAHAVLIVEPKGN